VFKDHDARIPTHGLAFHKSAADYLEESREQSSFLHGFSLAAIHGNHPAWLAPEAINRRNCDRFPPAWMP